MTYACHNIFCFFWPWPHGHMIYVLQIMLPHSMSCIVFGLLTKVYGPNYVCHHESLQLFCCLMRCFVCWYNAELSNKSFNFIRETYLATFDLNGYQCTEANLGVTFKLLDKNLFENYCIKEKCICEEWRNYRKFKISGEIWKHDENRTIFLHWQCD